MEILWKENFPEHLFLNSLLETYSLSRARGWGDKSSAFIRLRISPETPELKHSSRTRR